MHLRVETSQYMTSESAIPKEPTIVATCTKRVRQFCHVVPPPLCAFSRCFDRDTQGGVVEMTVSPTAVGQGRWKGTRWKGTR